MIDIECDDKTDVLRSQAREIANEIAAIIDGRKTVAIYCAIAQVLGRLAGAAPHPDVDALLKALRVGIEDQMHRDMEHG